MKIRHLIVLAIAALISTPSFAMQSVTIDVFDEVVTQDATPQSRILFEANPNSSIIARILICVRRPSDGATKAWDITSVMRRQGSGVAVNLATSIEGGLALGSVADLLALAGATIAFYADGNGNIGWTITGLAATDIEWGFMLRGIQVID